MILRRRRVILVRRYCCDWAVKSCRKHTNNNKEYILKQKEKTKTENIYMILYYMFLYNIILYYIIAYYIIVYYMIIYYNILYYVILYYSIL